MTHVHGVDDGHGYGVFGESIGRDGVRGMSKTGPGVFGSSDGSYAVHGFSPFTVGVFGHSNDGTGVWGMSKSGIAVYGFSTSSSGVYGDSIDNSGVYGESTNSVGIYGRSGSHVGVYGESTTSFGVVGNSVNSDGVWGQTWLANQSGVTGITELGTAAGITGINNHSVSSEENLAGEFFGNVKVTGNINTSAFSRRIDHPLDPANKYLYHSCVESPDMKNMYDGLVALDEKGEAVIDLPDWFGALNKDFRYQLTAIGAPGPNLYIAKEISETNTKYSNSSSKSSGKNHNSRFKIAGGTSGMKVSWQVTGIRADPYAKANPIQIEKDKPDQDRGYYIHPDLYGEPKEKMINYSIISRKVNRPEIAEGPPKNENKPNL